jgi:hypothetical protein
LTGLGALEALNSVSGRFVMQQVQKTKGAVSDREMAYFFKISANIGNTPLGNQLIINMARAINDRAIAENDLLNNFLSEEYEKNPNQSAYSLDQKFKKIRSKWRKDLSKFQEKYPNAKYMGETIDGKSQFQVNVDGDLQTFEI